jgi:hypothetical protein
MSMARCRGRHAAAPRPRAAAECTRRCFKVIARRASCVPTAGWCRLAWRIGRLCVLPLRGGSCCRSADQCVALTNALTNAPSCRAPAAWWSTRSDGTSSRSRTAVRGAAVLAIPGQYSGPRQVHTIVERGARSRLVRCVQRSSLGAHVRLRSRRVELLTGTVNLAHRVALPQRRKRLHSPPDNSPCAALERVCVSGPV